MQKQTLHAQQAYTGGKLAGTGLYSWTSELSSSQMCILCQGSANNVVTAC